MATQIHEECRGRGCYGCEGLGVVGDVQIENTGKCRNCNRPVEDGGACTCGFGGFVRYDSDGKELRYAGANGKETR